MAGSAYNNDPALLQQLEEQKGRLELYEKKLKDVVKAYKSIDQEKKALETALSAMSGDAAAAPAAAPSGAASTSSESHAGSDGEASNQADALKQAITTLTVENKKREIALQNDRRALLQKNEELKADNEKLQARFENQRKLKETIRQMEAENERLMSDHGKVAAEMQQSYAKERVHVEQLTELYKKVQEKDDLVKSYEGRLKQLAQLEEERDAWKRKADGTPTLTVLRQELANTKTSHEKELATLRQRAAQSGPALAEKDERIADLEGRVRDVTAKGVRWEEERVELQNTIEDLQQQLKDADAQVAEWKQKARSAAATAMSDDDDEDSERIRQRIRRDFERLRQLGAAEDPYDLLGVERPAASLSESLHPPADLADVTSASASNDNMTSADFSERCDSCHSAQKDLEYFKSLIGHLQKKIRVLEEKHDSTSTNYEKVAELLRKRVSELEAAQEHTYQQLTTETKRKVEELEDEMQRQRARMLEILGEKDKEIEVARQSLATLYAQRYGGNQDPVDPPQRRSASPAGELGMMRKSAESIRSALVQSEEVEHGAEFPRSRSPVKRSLSNYFGDARNVFYEQELMKREQEIVEMRNVMRLSEMKVRDMEQAMLTKDIQCLHLTETLKEEIRVLEGRLKLCQSETNLEYLRNIFVQFVNSPNAKGRKHILKAIGAVLKLTATEMRKIDSWNF